MQLEVEVEWTTSVICKFAVASISVGILSGALGIGGGIVITPLLLAHKQPPIVTSLTSVYIIFYISMSNTIQFVVNGSFIYSYAFFTGGIVFLGALIGLSVIKKLILISGRQSIVLFLVTGVSLVSVSLLVLASYAKTSEMIAQNQPVFEFNPICPAS